MNKLLFTLKSDDPYSEELILVANNPKDLEDYLTTNCDFHSISMYENYVQIIRRPGFEPELADLKWIKHI